MTPSYAIILLSDKVERAQELLTRVERKCKKNDLMLKSRKTVMIYLPTFSDSKARDFCPGSARILENDTSVAEDF